jgi:hypothetical protein
MEAFRSGFTAGRGWSLKQKRMSIGRFALINQLEGAHLMLRGKGRISTVILMVFAFLIGTASLSLAATQNRHQPGAMGCGWGGGAGGNGGNGWGCGKGWTGGNGIGWCNGLWGGQNGRPGTQFMAQGQVVAVDAQASTITVTLNGASPNLLTKLNLTNADLPADVTLQISPTVRVWGCGLRQGKWGSGSLTLASLKAGDSINLMGYFDKTGGDPVVSRINVWLY